MILKSGEDSEAGTWGKLIKLIEISEREIEILGVQHNNPLAILDEIGHSRDSILGSIVCNSGGVLIDQGWIRILGSGSSLLNRDIVGWNQGKAFAQKICDAEFLLVADDVVGGFFAINGGAWEGELGFVNYFSPESLDWVSLEIGYSQFIRWCLGGNLEEFYSSLRWEDWKDDIANLKGDEVFSIYPPLWSEERGILEEAIKKPVSIDSHYHFQLEIKESIFSQLS